MSESSIRCLMFLTAVALAGAAGCASTGGIKSTTGKRATDYHRGQVVDGRRVTAWVGPDDAPARTGQGKSRPPTAYETGSPVSVPNLSRSESPGTSTRTALDSPPAFDEGVPPWTRTSNTDGGRNDSSRALPSGGDEEDREDTELDRSRAGRRGGGGGPTRDEDRRERDDEEGFKSDLLARVLGLEDSDYSVFGWLQAGFMGNPARPADGTNFGLSPNDRANAFVFQQLYFVFEKRLDPEKADQFGWGFRTDNLFGTDWEQFHMVGLFDGAFAPASFGYEPVQFYGEIHLPWLTPGGIDVKGGRFYALPGYEDGRAPARPLNTGGYLFGYSHPFTHFGVMTTWHVTDRLNLYNGAVNGWDRWIDQNYRWGYAGGFELDSADDRTNFALTFNCGPNQFPYFFNNGYNLTLNGVTPPPFMAGKRNLLYPQNNAILFTEVLTHELTDALTLVGEADQGYEVKIPGMGPGGTTTDSTWYGFCGWLLYQFDPRVTGVYRAEMFRDVNGVRTGYNNFFYEMTLGLILKPRPWFWIRPETRWDWASGTPPYNDGRSNHQFTIGFDMIFLF